MSNTMKDVSTEALISILANASSCAITAPSDDEVDAARAEFHLRVELGARAGQQLKSITQILSKQQEQHMHTVTYIRKSQKAVDHPDGFVFLHRWPTGYQELVFQTLEDADKFCDSCNQPTTTKEINNGI